MAKIRIATHFKRKKRFVYPIIFNNKVNNLKAWPIHFRMLTVVPELHINTVLTLSPYLLRYRLKPFWHRD